MKRSHGKRKVFFLLDSFHIGGTETQAVELALRMNREGYDITLGCLRREGPLLSRLDERGIETPEFYPRGGIDSVNGMKQVFRLSLYLRRGRFDVVHLHDLWSNLAGIPAARLAGVRAIVGSQRDLSHDSWYRSRRTAVLRRIQRLASVILVNAAAIRDGLVRDSGMDPRKIRVIHNGIDVNRFKGAVRDRARIFPGADAKQLIVTVGNMRSEVKGHADLIEAAKLVIAERPDARFVLVGEGELRDTFERQIADLGLTEQFLFLGRRSDVPDILAAGDMGVLPSRAEGLPNAVLEYLTSGLPTVASAVGGNLEILQDGQTALLVPPRDPRALAKAVLRLLNDDQLSKRLAMQGQEYARANFSFDKLFREVDSLYTDLIEPGDQATGGGAPRTGHL